MPQGPTGSSRWLPSPAFSHGFQRKAWAAEGKLVWIGCFEQFQRALGCRGFPSPPIPSPGVIKAVNTVSEIVAQSVRAWLGMWLGSGLWIGWFVYEKQAPGRRAPSEGGQRTG